MKLSPKNPLVIMLSDTPKMTEHSLREYVGRSDTDLNGELKSKLSDRQKKFKYSYATSPKVAFEKECRNYHDFGESAKLDNKYHPAYPHGTNWKCPACNIFDNSASYCIV